MIYLGIVHKDPDSCYGITFPDVPGCFSAGDTLEELIAMSHEALELHLEDQAPPRARTFDELQVDPDFQEAFVDAVILLPIEFKRQAVAA